jgi:hypothetical protein
MYKLPIRNIYRIKDGASLIIVKLNEVYERIKARGLINRRY